MSEASSRTTEFLVALVGDLETVTAICSRCPEEISLEESFTGWEPLPKGPIQVLLVAHQDMAANGAALQFALILEDILNQPPRGDRFMRMRITVGSDVNLSHIEDHFRLVSDCAWAELQYTSAPGPVIPISTTNMSALLKRAATDSRRTGR